MSRTISRLLLGFVALSLLALGGVFYFGRCREGEVGEPPAWFVDATDEAGIDFVHQVGDLDRWDMPQIHGSGVAVFDYNGDGKLDLYFLTMGGAKNCLYKNVGNGKFVNASTGAGLDFVGENTGTIVGDVNNDGLPDVLVTQVAGLRLFLNKGDGTFADVSEQSGLKNPLWGTSANFFDYDKDGWLDLVVVNYLENDPTNVCRQPNGRRTYCGPAVFPGTVSRLFRNLGGDGKGVRFEDVTIKAGFAKAPGPGLAVYCADFDGDGWPDVFIVNDNKPNHLWMNKGNGTFDEEAVMRGIAVDALGRAQAGMGVAIGDISGTGMFDVYNTHLSNERNTLWQQSPKRGQFTDRTARAGLLHTDWYGTGFGTLFGDFDNDGWLDLGVVNGAVSFGDATQSVAPNEALGPHFSAFGQRNQLFRNLGKGKFADVSRQNPPFCGTPNVGRSLAVGDLDSDGGLDLVVTNVGGRARVYRNVACDRGHWLIVRTVDPRYNNRDAYGAEVVVKAGDREHLRLINPGDSYQSSSDPRAHFGLGEAANYDSIRVLWPDGRAEKFPGGKANQVVLLKRGEGTEVKP